MDEQTQVELEAAAFRRLPEHLDQRKDVQNIDLMNLAGFCRNCLSRSYVAEADERGLAMGYEAARKRVYSMRYSEWKVKYRKRAAAD